LATTLGGLLSLINKLKEEGESGGPIKKMLIVMSADPMGLLVCLVEVIVLKYGRSTSEPVEMGQVKG
jgi:hypothetical protein